MYKKRFLESIRSQITLGASYLMILGRAALCKNLKGQVGIKVKSKILSDPCQHLLVFISLKSGSSFWS